MVGGAVMAWLMIGDSKTSKSSEAASLTLEF